MPSNLFFQPTANPSYSAAFEPSAEPTIIPTPRPSSSPSLISTEIVSVNGTEITESEEEAEQNIAVKESGDNWLMISLIAGNGILIVIVLGFMIWCIVYRKKKSSGKVESHRVTSMTMDETTNQLQIEGGSKDNESVEMEDMYSTMESTCTVTKGITSGEV